MFETRTDRDRRVPRGTTRTPSAASSRLRTCAYPSRLCRSCRACCPRSLQPWPVLPWPAQSWLVQLRRVQRRLWRRGRLSRADSSRERRRSLGADATRQTRRCQRRAERSVCSRRCAPGCAAVGRKSRRRRIRYRCGRRFHVEPESAGEDWSKAPARKPARENQQRRGVLSVRPDSLGAPRQPIGHSGGRRGIRRACAAAPTAAAAPRAASA
jgi:hypothetical protein